MQIYNVSSQIVNIEEIEINNNENLVILKNTSEAMIKDTFQGIDVDILNNFIHRTIVN